MADFKKYWEYKDEKGIEYNLEVIYYYLKALIISKEENINIKTRLEDLSIYDINKLKDSENNQFYLYYKNISDLYDFLNKVYENNNMDKIFKVFDTFKKEEDFSINSLKKIEEYEDNCNSGINQNINYIEKIEEEFEQLNEQFNYLNIFRLIKEMNDEVVHNYCKTIEIINTEINKNIKFESDFSDLFLKSCSKDIAGEIVRNFFDMSDYNITVDQLYDRIINFRYENERDYLLENIKKNTYNQNNSKESLNILSDILGEAEKLFTKDNNQYIDRKIIEKGKSEHRENNSNIDKYGYNNESLDVDHTLPLATATYYSRYISNENVNNIKRAYNSEGNFAFLGHTANIVKGDARVYDENHIDITKDATVTQKTDVVIKKFENTKAVEKLQNNGILDKNGKVYPHIKTKIKEEIIRAENHISIETLKNLDYDTVLKDAAVDTITQTKKIIIGKIIYYIFPPVLYEIRINISKNKDIEEIIDSLYDSCDRVINYILEKKEIIFQDLSLDVLKKFFKNFFSILIKIVKATVKKILKLVMKLILTSIDAFRILMNKNKTFEEKMDSILKIVSGLVVTVICETIFELIEESFRIPEMFLMPLQIVTTVLASNFILLSLEQMDLFNVKNGYNLKKIDEIFNKYREENNEYIDQIINNKTIQIEDIYKQYSLIYENMKINLKEDLFEVNIKNTLNNLESIFGL